MEQKTKDNFKILGRFRDEDGTEKFVFQTEDGIIEITWIKNKNGIDVFCLPTHHYCNLGCQFCHLTAEGGRDRKMVLISAENMCAALAQILKPYAKNDKILFSFMGVGEPFLNLDLVFSVYDHFSANTDKEVGLALASMMLTPKPFGRIIEKVEKCDLPLKIHFSLHSPSDVTRKDIIPSAPTTITQCLSALKNYEKKISSNSAAMENLAQFHQKSDVVEIHYTVIEGVNDSDRDLKKMIEFGNEYQIPLKLLKFNPTQYLNRSPRTDFWFKELSKNYGAQVCLYAPPGPNIGSSCGQFTKHYYLGSNSREELKEFEAWKKKYEVVEAD